MFGCMSQWMDETVSLDLIEGNIRDNIREMLKCVYTHTHWWAASDSWCHHHSWLSATRLYIRPPPTSPPHLTAGSRKSCLSDLLQDSHYNFSPTHKLPVMGKVPHISALLTAPHQPNIYHKDPLSPPTVPQKLCCCYSCVYLYIYLINQ